MLGRLLTAEVTITMLAGTGKPWKMACMDVRHSPRKELESALSQLWEDLAMWTLIIVLFRVLLGKAGGTTQTQPHGSCEYNHSPAKKVLRTKTLPSSGKINLSTNLLYAPKLWSLDLWFVQVRETVLDNKLSWPWEYFLVQSKTVYCRSV